MQLTRDMEDMEYAKLGKGLARYNCRWCGSAYVLWCQNPICRATGSREPPKTKHQYPSVLVKGIQALRLERRLAENEAMIQQQVELFEGVRRHVKAFKAAHPSRASVVVSLPRVTEEPSYYYINADKGPFYTQLPARKRIGYETVRVTLADGTYKASNAQAEIAA